MTGWNMPPGCNPSDIPGNRPEDQREDAFWDMLDKKLTEENIDTVSMQRYPGDDAVITISELWDDIHFVKLINIVRDLAWKDGYVSGQADEAMHSSECVEHKYRNYDNGLGWVCRDCGAEAPKDRADALDAARKELDT